MQSNGSARVHYFERQFLRPEDFSDEQAYHVAMHRRHNLAQHTWGIVHGLTLKAEEGAVFVQPGYAVDGYGRDAILASRQKLPVEQFAQKNTDVLNVWMLYGQSLSNPAPDGYAGCGPNSTAQYRETEPPSFRLDPPDFSYPDPRQPKGVPAADYQFDATEVPPDDPSTIWPVFLGQITKTGDSNNPYTVDLSNRPYAGLAGESVTAPSGQTTVQIGQPADKTGEPGFAVFIKGSAAARQKPPEPSLAIDNQDEITLRGDATVYGNLKLPSGALEFSTVQPASATGVNATMKADSAQPWKIYIARNDKGQTELRIEMASSGKGNNLVSIGAFNADSKKFEPCFSVDDQCNVTVEKDLSVGGKIVGPDGGVPDVVLAGVSDQVRQLLLGTLMSGIGGTSAVLGQFFKPPAPPSPAVLVEALGSNPQQLDQFVAAVKTSPAVRAALKAAL